jgi:hypothetical protein
MCRNRNCPDYVPNCTNYSYVCPSCTNCCVDPVDAKCVIYKGVDLDCIPAEATQTLEQILAAINTKLCSTVGATFDIQCMGGISVATQSATIQALIDHACADNLNVFDTTCLGGQADRTIYQAMSNVITKICNSDYTYPTIDTSCMTGGDANSDLTEAVTLLVDAMCVGPIHTLDWEDLVAPSPTTDTPIQDILEAIVDNLRCQNLTFSNEFNITTNANCTKDVELDIEIVTPKVLDEIEDKPALTTQLRNIGLAKMFSTETSEKGSIEEQIAFSTKFHVTKSSRVPYNFTMTLGNGGAGNTFVGIVFPTGMYHEQTFLLSNTSGLQSWLNGLGLGVFTVTAIVGGITITTILDGDLTDFYPIAVWKNTALSTTLLNSTVTGSQQSASVSSYMHIEIDEPTEWLDVTYQNTWTGNIKYRYNPLNKTVEIRPGYLNKSQSPSYVASLSEIAFTIPYTSDGKAVWRPYAYLISTCADPTDCVVNARVRVENSSSNFYVDIDDCVRSGDPCSPGDVITMEMLPTFYYTT